MTENRRLNGDDHSSITSSELQYILDVNRKAIEIYAEIGKQYEVIDEKLNTMTTKVSEMEKHFFRLLLFLGLFGAGLIFQICQLLFHK